MALRIFFASLVGVLVVVVAVAVFFFSGAGAGCTDTPGPHTCYPMNPPVQATP